jgi:hypothetical protein
MVCRAVLFQQKLGVPEWVVYRRCEIEGANPPHLMLLILCLVVIICQVVFLLFHVVFLHL